MNVTYENGTSVKIAGVNGSGQTVYDVVLKPTRGRITFRDAGHGIYVLESNISGGCVRAIIRSLIKIERRLKQWTRRCLFEYFKNVNNLC